MKWCVVMAVAAGIGAGTTDASAGGMRLRAEGSPTATHRGSPLRLPAVEDGEPPLPVEPTRLQERIDAAEPGATLVVGPGTYAGPLVISKPLRLIGEGLPHLHGPGQGRVLTVSAPDVTVRGFRISGSGLRLMDDDAAVFVTGDRAMIEANDIRDSLHGIYLKRANDARVVRNRIRGKTALPVPGGPVEAGLGGGDCDASLLVANRRGNGIHQWNCERNELSDNEISDARDGIYFSFTNHCRVSRNRVRNVRYGLHYMYSNDNEFVGNEFSENAAGAALMFSQRLVVRDNRFVNNRGFRAYGLIFQSVDDTRIEGNRIERNAVGLSFNQCNRNRVVRNRIASNYIGLRFGSNSDENAFSMNRFARNLTSTGMGSAIFHIASSICLACCAGISRRWVCCRRARSSRRSGSRTSGRRCRGSIPSRTPPPSPCGIGAARAARSCRASRDLASRREGWRGR